MIDTHCEIPYFLNCVLPLPFPTKQGIQNYVLPLPFPTKQGIQNYVLPLPFPTKQGIQNHILLNEQIKIKNTLKFLRIHVYQKVYSYEWRRYINACNEIVETREELGQFQLG